MNSYKGQAQHTAAEKRTNESIFEIYFLGRGDNTNHPRNQNVITYIYTYIVDFNKIKQ